MGVHTGEPLLTGEGYVGVDVHKAARICSAGHGGQVLVSERTQLAVDAADLRPLGLHRLKDLTAPEPLYQLGVAEFPPLKSLNQSNLPVQPTPFVGREKELGELLVLVQQEELRLLTLTGAGGSGKTRLAVQAAAEVVEQHEHGVWWVGLQAVRDTELVLPAIASAIGAKDELAEHIGGRRMLLVLDNLEQLVEAAPGLGSLLSSCPRLRLLVTSREPLRLAGEQEYPVPPFVEQEAVGFFFSRARAVRPGFEDDGSVRAICARLDHLPLALELAAARVKALSPAQILERLEQSLPLLTGGARDAPERQRTLRGTIGWSYELLAPEEQRLFSSLSVFAGGCSLEAAEQALGADLDGLQSLVDKSLLRFDEERYSMLATILEFAREQLEDSGEAVRLRRAHADFFLALAESAAMSAEHDYGRRYDLLPPEKENLRAAIDWLAAAGEIERALQLAIALENFWVILDPFEGMRRFETLLGEGGVPDIVRARGLRCFAGCSFLAGKFEQAQRANQESLAIFRAADDEAGIAELLHRIGINTLMLGDRERAREQLEESLALLPEARLGPRRGRGDRRARVRRTRRARFRVRARVVRQERGDVRRGRLHLVGAEHGRLWGRLRVRARPDRRIREEGPSCARAGAADRRQAVADLHARAHGAQRGVPWRRGPRGTSLGRARGRGGACARRPVGSRAREICRGVSAVDGPEFERACEEGRRLSFEAAILEAREGVD